MKEISVLIPVYNSEKTIADVCRYLLKLFIESYKLQIVLVNDGSQDRSGEICRALHAAFSDVVVYVELARNFGEHNALMAGLRYVTGECCVMMDDDFQNPPEEAKKLIEAIEQGYDVVYTYYTDRKDPLLRRLGSCFHDKIATLVMMKPAGLYLSSYKCINRFLIDEVIKFDGQDPYLDGIILRSTDRVGTVPVAHEARRHGESGYTFRKLLSLWSSMVLNFSLIPLRLIGMLGFALTVISVIYGVYKRFFEAPYDPLSDHEWMMTVILFLVGLIFFSIALLAEYVGRMYLFMNKQPQYIVREALVAKPLR